MGQAGHDHHADGRCGHCRYWFERCCHALALAEGADRAPIGCGHFTRAVPIPRPGMEAAPC